MAVYSHPPFRPCHPRVSDISTCGQIINQYQTSPKLESSHSEMCMLIKYVQTLKTVSSGVKDTLKQKEIIAMQ